MKIPNEALPLRQRESETPADAKEKNTKPVGGAAQTRSALSNLSFGQGRSGTKDKDLDEGNPWAIQNGRRNRDQPDERRREERRKANQPIMLDTRTTRSRRKSARTPTINFKI